MLFPTIRFAVFFLVTWGVLLGVRRHPLAWRLVLLGANWVFYAAWNLRFVALLAGSVLVNHGAVRLIASGPTERRRRMALWTAVSANVAVLGFFKYYGFFTDSLRSALSGVGVRVHPPVLELVLPLGLSFFTFQAISYLIEVRRETIEPAPLLDEAVWLSFFPTVVSGPITRASEFMPQIDAARSGEVDANEALLLIVRGLFKKVVIASYLATALTDKVFATPDRFTSIEIVIGVYAFAVQLYADFSGYTDMARGCALLLGIRLPENFLNPYGATSIRVFWDRWHITLSHWLRDFLFTPLARRAGNRRWSTYCNLILVMLIAGLWHGAAWTFVAFGAVHGIGLAAERWWRDERRIHRWRSHPHSAWRKTLSWVVTFNTISLGWLCFRAESLGSARHLLARIVTAWGVPHALTPMLLAVVIGSVGLQVVPASVWRQWRAAPTAARLTDVFSHMAIPAQAAILAVSLVVIDVLGPVGVPPFLYFKF